jgi:hypothetical protein
MTRLLTIALTLCAVLAQGQDKEYVTKIVSHYSEHDSANQELYRNDDGSEIEILGGFDNVGCPQETIVKINTPKPLTLDSLVVLWDEYKAECDSLNTAWERNNEWWVRKIVCMDGFMDFIRRKAGE